MMRKVQTLSETWNSVSVDRSLGIGSWKDGSNHDCSQNDVKEKGAEACIEEMLQGNVIDLSPGIEVASLPKDPWHFVLLLIPDHTSCTAPEVPSLFVVLEDINRLKPPRRQLLELEEVCLKAEPTEEADPTWNWEEGKVSSGEH